MPLSEQAEEAMVMLVREETVRVLAKEPAISYPRLVQSLRIWALLGRRGLTHELILRTLDDMIHSGQLWLTARQDEGGEANG